MRNINIPASYIILKTRHYKFLSCVKRIDFLHKLICYESSLPSHTKALQELSMSDPRKPLRHMIAPRKRAKFTFVRKYNIASVYDSSLFSAILLASCLLMRVSDGPAPPCRNHERNEVTLLDVKYSLLILQVLQRLMKLVRFY